MDVADRMVNVQRDGKDCQLEEAKMIRVSLAE